MLSERLPRRLGAMFFSFATVLSAAPRAMADQIQDSEPPESTPSTLETLVVTGSPLSRDAADLSTVVDQVGEDEIRRQGGANLADALSRVPGVTGSGFAAGASRPVIRGFDANRVRLLENGIGSFDVSDVGPDHGVPIDPLSAKRIEVVRGAGTLRYGSQAIGGVVNAINNRVPLELPDEPFAGEFGATWGSAAETRQGAAEIDGRLGAFALHADGFARDTDDYEIPGGTQPNSFFRGSGFAAGSSYFFGADEANRIGLAGIRYDAKYGIPGEENHIDMEQTKGLLRSSLAVGQGAWRQLDVDGGYADYQHSERAPDGTRGATFKDQEWDLRLEALFDPLGPFSSSALGVQLQNRDFSALGEGAEYLAPTETASGAAFAFAEAPLNPRLRLQAGLRAERVQVDGTPVSALPVQRDFTPLSASAGLLFDASEVLRLGLTASSTARAPAQTELFARGPHEGSATYETGDPELGVERANSLEGTLRLRRGRLRLEAALWVSQFSDYIFGELSGRVCDEAGVCVLGGEEELKELDYTQRDARFRGAELKSTLALHEGPLGLLEADILADYVRATLDGGENVPRIPPYHLGGGLSWKRDRVEFEMFLKYAGKQDKLGQAETGTDDYVTLDAHLGWRPLRRFPDFEVLLAGHNLTDSRQRNAVALNKEDVLMPGRDLRLSLHTAF